jgi:hypothetical protein
VQGTFFSETETEIETYLRDRDRDPEIIQRMMDLGTVKRKLDRSQFHEAAEVAFDIRQVWKNCMTYNAEGSDFWLLAKAYSKRFEDRYRRIRNEYDVGKEPVIEMEEEEEESEDAEDDDEVVSRSRPRDTGSEQGDDDDDYDDDPATQEDASERSPSVVDSGTPPPPPKLDSRARFAANLLLLNGVELGTVISKLEKMCPESLEQGATMAVPEQLEIVIDSIDGDTFIDVSHMAEKAANRQRSRTSTRKSTMSPDHRLYTARASKCESYGYQRGKER